MSEDQLCLASLLELVECPLLFFIPLELHSVLCDMRGHSEKLGEVSNEAPIGAETVKPSYCLLVRRRRKGGYGTRLFGVRTYTSLFTTYPKNLSSSLAKWHFVGLSVSPAALIT